MLRWIPHPLPPNGFNSSIRSTTLLLLPCPALPKEQQEATSARYLQIAAHAREHKQGNPGRDSLHIHPPRKRKVRQTPLLITFFPPLSSLVFLTLTNDASVRSASQILFIPCGTRYGTYVLLSSLPTPIRSIHPSINTHAIQSCLLLTSTTTSNWFFFPIGSTHQSIQRSIARSTKVPDFCSASSSPASSFISRFMMMHHARADADADASDSHQFRPPPPFLPSPLFTILSR